MRKFYLNFLAVVALLCVSFAAKATGWPANYQGVMLQGFYWDSYTDTKWTNLTSMADEYSKYFTLIWVPNSAKPASSPSMGYDPVYWFTNHSSSFGTEADLRKMIATYKAKGVGIIEDVVVNHRSGRSNWYDFPAETWNGKTWQISTGSICSTDEVWRDGGHGCPASYKGAPDTGEDFGSSRDLDHTNATVQDNVKNYCKFLIDDLGYAGFRLDMVKGYGGQYTKIYNQYSKPQFCVGECFDGSYDVCAAWIEATGKESASFDFPLKFQLNKAFPSASSYNLTELCWTNPSGALQPAGLIHYGYTQYAVTFVDNHDTYRDHNKFNGNVLAANAFILCSPGTPCVFLAHYKNYKSQIQALINVRNEVGVHNLSAVNVLKCTKDCYMAEVTGTKGKLVVRIGSTNDAPSGGGYNLKCSGNGYSVWATTAGGITPDPTPNPGGSYPASLYLMGHTNGYEWATDKGVEAKGKDGVYTWSNVSIDDAGAGKGYFAFSTILGADWDAVNSGDRYGASSSDEPIAKGQSAPITLYAAGVNASGSQSWMIDAGSYSITADLKNMKITIAEVGSTPDPTPNPGDNYPATLYLMGHTNGYEWATDKGIEAKGNKGVYTWSNVSIDDAGAGKGYFAFATILGADWDAVNSGDRYGASSSDEPIAKGQSAPITLYAAGVNASGSQSWMIDAGSYSITADLANMKITISEVGTTPDPKPDPDPTPDPNPESYPASLYLLGHTNGYEWATDKGLEAKGKDGVYSWSKVAIDDADNGYGYFAFATILGADWDAVNSGDRYGASTADEPIGHGMESSIALYAAGVNASASQSWKIAAGSYNINVDLSKMIVSVSAVDAAVNGIDADSDAPVFYYNLQGVRVENPAPGIYIRVQGNKVSKIFVLE